MLEDYKNKQLPSWYRTQLAQAGKKGGHRRWAGKTKEEIKEEMAKVREARKKKRT